MPELPEVETIVRDLRKEITGKKITNIEIRRSSIIQNPSMDFCDSVLNKRIKTIDRTGKYLVFELTGGLYLLAHLRMTGKFIVESLPVSDHVHNRVIFHLDGDQALIYSDVRCFGTIEKTNRSGLTRKLKHLGWDPWDKELTPEKLRKRLSNRSVAIKSVLLDQHCIAGLGNIYASEILFDARISPFKKSNSLSLKKLAVLIHSTRKILEKALENNGTSISDYRRVDDKQGSFQNMLKVYGKKDSPCPVCSKPILGKRLNQRSTFYCSKCQK